MNSNTNHIQLKDDRPKRSALNSVAKLMSRKHRTDNALRKHVHVIYRKFFGFKNENFHRKKKMIFFLFLLKT